MSQLQSQRWAEKQRPWLRNKVQAVLTPDMTLRECAAKIQAHLPSVRACAKVLKLPYKREPYFFKSERYDAGKLKAQVVLHLNPTMTLRELAEKIDAPLPSVRACVRRLNLDFKRERRPQKFHAESFK